ncbi:fungal-specific transcription factor domain-containing protein [Aspergillus aurantiobrunneus]
MESSSPPPSSHLDEAQTSRPKRRKIAVACDECRGRKVRCDGVQPVCGQCAKRTGNARCKYTGESEKKRAARNYISSLENRIKHLERPPYSPGIVELSALPGSSRASQQGSSSSYRASFSTGTPTSLKNKSLPSPVQHQSHHGTTSFGPGAHASPRGNQNSVHGQTSQSGRPPPKSNEDTDGVNAMMGAVEEERPSQGFFGSSSAASFMRQIKTAVDKMVSSLHQQTSDSVLRCPPSSLMSNPKERLTTVHYYVLPPRKTADNLMAVYWHYVFPLYPLVDSIRLREEYARIWTGDSVQSDENMLMCTFNVIFALACQLADFIPPEEREASAAAFFARAKDLLHFNLWDSGSAGLIQCLLLMAQYLQSTDSAHYMGLHLPQTFARLESPQEQQLARKIWHGCVLMDRVVSMTFGRPAMISKASCGSVPLPATIDEEYIASASGTDIAQPADQPSIMAFYAKSLELYDILNDILLSLYKPVTEESPDDIYDFYFSKSTSDDEITIFELDRSLTKWSRSLPAHLRGETTAGSNGVIFYRQTVVLRARFLHVRMLLFRPILSKYCTSRDIAFDPLISLADSFPQRVALQCSIICIKVASEIIELIHSNIPIDGTSGSLPAWWYNILYVYTAATVIVASRLCPTILEEISESALTRSWNCALEILRKYQSYSTSARRCVAALEILYERAAVSAASTTEQNQPQGEGVFPMQSSIGDMSLGEGLNAGLLEGFDLPDFQDMSWLNSVPSHLY